MSGIYHLAQINIARVLAPLDDPLLQDFMDGLEPINALADAAPGFVWRLQTENGDATSIQAFDDKTILVNMSVWQDVASLRQYVYKTQHVAFLRRRKEWFEKFAGVFVALWWIPAGHIPTTEEAKARLAFLEQHGDSPYAFTFKKPFSASEADAYKKGQVSALEN
jgi:hypothetical protein